VVTVTVAPGQMAAHAGEIIPIAIILDHQPGWQTAAAQAGAGAEPSASVAAEGTPTSVRVLVDDSRFLVREEATQWLPSPAPESPAQGGLSQGPSLKNRTHIYLPLEIRPDAAPGNTNVVVLVSYQASSDGVRLPPVDEQRFDLTLAITPGAAALYGGGSNRNQPELFTGYRAIGPSLGSGIRASPGSIGLITIMTAALVAVGVVGVVVIAVLRRSDARPGRVVPGRERL